MPENAFRILTAKNQFLLYFSQSFLSFDEIFWEVADEGILIVQLPISLPGVFIL